MTDLPNPSPPPQAPPASPVIPIQPVSSGNKEIPSLSGMVDLHEGLSDATGQELELPKEVQSAGVRIQPTTISLPAPIAKLGVAASGANIPIQTTSTIVLPLSDDQIAIGLHQAVTNSMRWLAEWCVRRLKFLHITLKNVHGKFVRVKE